MRFKYLYSFYFLNVYRSKLYLMSCIILISFLIIRITMYMNTWFAQESYGQLPAEIFVIVQTISILFMIYFYRVFSNELKFGIHNFFNDGYKILIEKVTALLFVHISLQILLTFIVYVIFAVVYLFQGIEFSMFYIDLFRFLIDYMFFPLLISALIGVITALMFGINKISIFFILIVWFFTGVINQEIFYAFFHKVGANDWETLLSVGPTSIYSVYYSYIGFNINTGLEFKLLTWLLILITILLIASIKYIFIKREKRIILATIFCLTFTSVGTGYLSIHKNVMAFSNGDLVRETTYYEHMDSVNVDLNYTIDEYNIELDGNIVRAEILFDRTTTNEPSFQLYHAYPIHNVLVDNQEVTYSREGDMVHIHNNTDKFKKIVFNYELVDTNLVPYSIGRTMLLANHAWYPKKRMHHVYDIDLYSGSIQLTENIAKLLDENHRFRLKADDLLFTNIDVKDNYYEGKTSALTIIKGQGNRLTSNGYDVIYPADWPHMSKRVQEVIARLEIIFDEINRIVPMKINTLPTKIVFTEDETSSFINNNHLIYTTNGAALAINDEEVMKDFEKTLIELMIEPKGSKEMYNEWVNMSIQMIKKIQGFHIYEPGPTIDLIDSSSQDKVNDIHSLFSSLSAKEKRSFLKQWYFSMDDSWTWEDVELLMKEGKFN